MRTSRRTVRLWLTYLWVLFSTSTCASSDGVLEVEMQLPYDGTSERRFASLEVRPADGWPFEDQWGVESYEYDLALNACATERSESPRCNVRFAVVSASELPAIHIRVRFCDEPGCPAGAAPELRFRLERPLYSDRITRWRPSDEPFITIPDRQPTTTGEVLFVPRCEIEGCLQGIPTPDFGWCEVSEGELRHFCE